MQLLDVREEINQMRESNIRLFRATAREMDILRKENRNLTSILLTLKENFDSIVPNFLEQRDKIRELETWRMNMENHQMPIHQKNVQKDAQDVNYEEFLQDQDENDGNEQTHNNVEQDNEQKQADSNKEDESNVLSTPASIISKMREVTEPVVVSAEIESVKVESVLEAESVVVNDSMINNSRSKDTTQEKFTSGNEESSMELDSAKTYCIVQSSTIEEASTMETPAENVSAEADSAEMDSNEEDEMESIAIKEELTEEGLLEENGSTDNEVANQESTCIESTKQVLLKIEPTKVDGEEEKMMDVAMTELEIANSSSEEMDLANKESSLAEDNSKAENSTEISSKQGDVTMSNPVAEEEPIDKQLPKAGLAEDELARTEGSKEEDEAVDKEPTNDVSTNLESSMEETIEHDFIKQESMDPNSRPKDRVVEESKPNHANVENASDASTQKDVQETIAMKKSTAVSLNEKDSAEQDSALTGSINHITSAPLKPSSVPDQVATTSTSTSKPKRKFKNPVVLIKKRRKTSSKSL